MRNPLNMSMLGSICAWTLSTLMLTMSSRPNASFTRQHGGGLFQFGPSRNSTLFNAARYFGVSTLTIGRVRRLSDCE